MRAGRCQGKERHGPCRLARCLSWHRGPACARVLCSPGPVLPQVLDALAEEEVPPGAPRLGVGGASLALLNGALHACGNVPPSRDWPPCPERSLRRPCGQALSDLACPGARHLSRAVGPQPAEGSCSPRGPAPGPAEHLGTGPGHRPLCPWPPWDLRRGPQPWKGSPAQRTFTRGPPRGFSILEPHPEALTSPPCPPPSFESPTAGLPSLPPTSHP